MENHNNLKNVENVLINPYCKSTPQLTTCMLYRHRSLQARSISTLQIVHCILQCFIFLRCNNRSRFKFVFKSNVLMTVGKYIYPDWVIPEKIHTSPTDGILEIFTRGGDQRLWKSRREGGLNFRKSSAGVISTDSSRDSNIEFSDTSALSDPENNRNIFCSHISHQKNMII